MNVGTKVYRHILRSVIVSSMLILVILACETVPEEPEETVELQPFSDHMAQSMGIRVHYPDGWEAAVPASASGPTLTLFPGNGEIRATAVSLDGEADPWKLTEHYARRTSENAEVLGVIEINDDVWGVFELSDGMGAVSFADADNLVVVIAEGERYRLEAGPENDEVTAHMSDEFQRLIAGVEAVGTRQSARELNGSLLFVEQPEGSWLWISDSRSGFVLASAADIAPEESQDGLWAYVEPLPANAADDYDEPVLVSEPLSRFELFGVSQQDNAVRLVMGVEHHRFAVSLPAEIGTSAEDLLAHEGVRELFDESLALAP